MKVFKRAVFIFLLVAVSFAIGGISLRAFSQDKPDFSKITLSVGDGMLNFFDYTVGTVYMYSEATGRLVATYTLKELGKDMDKTTMSKIVTSY
ncbi:MAG: hypothetical protein PHF11_05345 [Candidatus Omnitrophica bacterium]|nr:hypothetical protein [Candidatus Omnitrophota bacterium]